MGAVFVELSERLPRFDWECEPLAFALFAFFHLQERDRVRGWERRMHRVEEAGYAAIAFHEPDRLGRERELVLNDARKLSPEPTDWAAWSRELSERLESGKVLES